MSNRLLLAGVLIVSISVAAFEAGIGLSVNSATAASERTYGRFEGVILHGCYDGDTCTFTIPRAHPLLGDHIGVRLRGIDTPEIRGKCEKEKALARKARDRLEGLLKAAGRIDLVDVARDKYFRILADVEAEGVDVAGVLLREGLARGYDGSGARASWCVQKFQIPFPIWSALHKRLRTCNTPSICTDE